MQDERKGQGPGPRSRYAFHRGQLKQTISVATLYQHDAWPGPWRFCCLRVSRRRADPLAQVQARISTALGKGAFFGLIAPEAGDVAQVRAWLDAGLDPDCLADRVGTGLMIAAWHGNIPMMELLVARGADVNKSNALGEQALMHAAWRGNVDAVKWLLAKGARVNNGNLRWSAIHYSAFAGQGKATALLLDNGADINARSTNGSSPLMMAVYEGHEDMVKQLLARGADRSVKTIAARRPRMGVRVPASRHRAPGFGAAGVRRRRQPAQGALAPFETRGVSPSSRAPGYPLAAQIILLLTCRPKTSPAR